MSTAPGFQGGLELDIVLASNEYWMSLVVPLHLHASLKVVHDTLYDP
jgi:hypothetical protein